MNKRIKKKYLPLAWRSYRYVMRCRHKRDRYTASRSGIRRILLKNTWLYADDDQHEIIAYLVDGYVITENLYMELDKFIITIPWVRDLINMIRYGSVNAKVARAMTVKNKSVRHYMKTYFPKWTLLDSYSNPSNPEVSIWDENINQFKTITPKVIYVDFNGTTPIFKDKDGNVINITV